MESSVNKLSLWPLVLIFHFLLAAGGGMLIGFLPEALVGRPYYNTGLEPYSPMIAVSAFLLGYFLSSRLLDLPSARWTWIIGLAWLLFGIWDDTRHWSPMWSVEKTRWRYVLANFFGPTISCSDSECIGELMYTTPFAASVTYSLGAFLRNRRLRRASAADSKPSSTSASSGRSVS